jgi:hypothetical protein
MVEYVCSTLNGFLEHDLNLTLLRDWYVGAYSLINDTPLVSGAKLYSTHEIASGKKAEH